MPQITHIAPNSKRPRRVIYFSQPAASAGPSIFGVWQTRPGVVRLAGDHVSSAAVQCGGHDMKRVSAIPVAAAFALILATSASGATNPGPVNAGSPTAPFSQNKQNEPALAVD